MIFNRFMDTHNSFVDVNLLNIMPSSSQGNCLCVLLETSPAMSVVYIVEGSSSRMR